VSTKRLSRNEVIEQAKKLWIKLRDDYMKGITKESLFQREIPDDEKDKLFQSYLSGYFERPYGMDEFIKDAVTEHEKLAKLSDTKYAEWLKNSRKERL
jgi:hypothetical protein